MTQINHVEEGIQPTEEEKRISDYYNRFGEIDPPNYKKINKHTTQCKIAIIASAPIATIGLITCLCLGFGLGFGINATIGAAVGAGTAGLAAIIGLVTLAAGAYHKNAAILAKRYNDRMWSEEINYKELEYLYIEYLELKGFKDEDIKRELGKLSEERYTKRKTLSKRVYPDTYGAKKADLKRAINHLKKEKC